VTTEASYSKRRGFGAWALTQAKVSEGLRQATLNLCLTRQDRDGLANNFPGARLAILPPFIDTAGFQGADDARAPDRLVTVAMMRPGDKLESYRMLAGSLHRLHGIPWRLSIVGDGPCRDEVNGLFEGFADKVSWHGQLPQTEVGAVLSGASLYVWPGCGEAFGLAYLEAQANGLPVVAQHTAGVPEVVVHGETGLLTAEGDADAYVGAIEALLSNTEERRRLGANARRLVETRHSLNAAAPRLDELLREALGQ
jgi:glycosyltransferase involved in cell wall biosynthesis